MSTSNSISRQEIEHSQPREQSLLFPLNCFLNFRSSREFCFSGHALPKLVFCFSLLAALCRCGPFPVSQFQAETLSYPTMDTVVKKITEYSCASGDYNIMTYSMDDPYELISTDHNRLPDDKKDKFNEIIESLDVAKYKNNYTSRPFASAVDSSYVRVLFLSGTKAKEVFVNTSDGSSVPEALSNFCTTVRVRGFI